MATTIRSSSQLYIDANLDFKNNKGVNLMPGTSTGHAVEYDQMYTAISNATTGVGNAIHAPVADLAAAKAVTDYIDKMLMLIETMGLYRFDAEATTASNDNTIIRPTNIASDASPGRWIKMSATITDHNLLSGIQGGTTGEYYHLTAAQAGLLAGSALSSSNDTNVTLTLGGTPATALLKAVSLTLGWTGTLADARIASAAAWNAKVDSVTAGAGIVQNGTAKAPIFDIVSAVGTAGSVGTIVVTADAVGVALGTTSTTAAAGNHTHAGMGTVTSVTAGNGLTQSGTATINPTIDVVSHAGTAGSVGTLVITADSVGVALGTTSITAARGDHNHTVGSLTDTTITSIADNHILAWDTSTSKWTNQTPAELGILTGNQSITLSGDVSGTGTTAITTTIGANKVTLAMMATVATQTFLGRNTASTGNVEVLSVATAKTMLGLNTANLSTRSYRIVPTGSINGSNTVFTLTANVLSGSEEVYKNGMLMNAGAGNDYTITYGATTTITFLTAPSSTPFADIILVNYSV